MKDIAMQETLVYLEQCLAGFEKALKTHGNYYDVITVEKVQELRAEVRKAQSEPCSKCRWRMFMSTLTKIIGFLATIEKLVKFFK